VYFSSGDENAYALTADGHKKWQFASGMSGHSTPAISQSGTIYVGSGDGRLYALNPDGSEKWESATGGEVYSPAIAPDGTVYVHSGDGNLYAFSDENGGLGGQWPKLNADLHNTGRANHRP
jgi:outer membrane protein assembly factor BamB